MSTNGRLVDGDLSPTQIGGRLRADAAGSADRLALAFGLHFGSWLRATDTYRSLAQQITVRQVKGTLAAIPGTSNHGWGIAVDFASGINTRGSAEHKWMQENAGRYGWRNPDWATPGRPGFEKDEPWHWEFDGAADRMTKARAVRTPTRRGELGVGARGAAVREVQLLLNRALVPKNRIAVDGDYGFGTALAVVKFQRSRRMSVTGTVGPRTRRRLQRDAR